MRMEDMKTKKDQTPRVGRKPLPSDQQGLSDKSALQHQ